MKYLVFLIAFIANLSADAQISISKDKISLGISHSSNFIFGDEGKFSDISDIENVIGVFDTGVEYGQQNDSLDLQFNLNDQIFGQNGWNGSQFVFSLGYSWGQDASRDRWKANVYFSSGKFHAGRGVRLSYTQEYIFLGSGFSTNKPVDRFNWSVGVGFDLSYDGSFNRNINEIDLKSIIQEKFILDAEMYDSLSLSSALERSDVLYGHMRPLLEKKIVRGAFSASADLSAEGTYDVLEGLEGFVRAGVSFDVLNLLLNKVGRHQSGIFVSLGVRYTPY